MVILHSNGNYSLQGGKMTDIALTERQLREKEYYEVYAKSNTPCHDQIDLAPVNALIKNEGMRPWNSYWAIYEFAWRHFDDGKILLDFGSGPGDNALRLANLGYKVEGFDISDANVEIANNLFKENGANGKFQYSTAESLPYDDASFEIIVGIDILHHVDIPKAMKECKRVLKFGGKAFFREPVDAPLFDWLRNTRAVKAVFPKDVSFENHITEDERKLNFNDEIIMESTFPNIKKHYYLLFARLDKLYRKGADPRPSMLERLDYFLIKRFPFLKKFCGVVIYELSK